MSTVKTDVSINKQGGLAMKLIMTLSILLGLAVSGMSGEPTAAQYFYTAKKLMPEAMEISIFMSKDQLDVHKSKIERAATQFNLSPTIYVIESSKNIGQSINKMNDNGLLLIYETPELMDKSSRLFVLSKCKDKNIKIISSSLEYSQQGAFLGLITNDDKRIEHFIVNLKHSEPALASIFTDEFISQVGVTEVIR